MCMYVPIVIPARMLRLDLILVHVLAESLHSCLHCHRLGLNLSLPEIWSLVRLDANSIQTLYQPRGTRFSRSLRSEGPVLAKVCVYRLHSVSVRIHSSCVCHH